jgi:hypothetical protein
LCFFCIMLFVKFLFLKRGFIFKALVAHLDDVV